MSLHVFTSFTYAYLDRARVLANTLKAWHPDWTLWAVIVDRPPVGTSEAALMGDFDRVLGVHDIFPDWSDNECDAWLFRHDVVEACTAVKGQALCHLLDKPDVTKVIYLDPDIAVLGDLGPIERMLDDAAIVLTPHQVDPDPKGNRASIIDNEMASLQYGVFNFGFVAVSDVKEGRRFARWWADRLEDWCVDDLSRGLFTDQKWCNLVPCFFDDVKILRDPGYNVASWNLSQRRVAFDADGNAEVNGVPLRFFHFTKLGPVGDVMTRRYAIGNPEVFELWFWYRNSVAGMAESDIPHGYWHFGRFDNGVAIPRAVRRLYRVRRDLRDAFPRPFQVEDGLFTWLRNEGHLPAEASATETT